MCGGGSIAVMWHDGRHVAIVDYMRGAVVSVSAHGRKIECICRLLEAEAVGGSQVDCCSLDRPAEVAEGSNPP